MDIPVLGHLIKAFGGIPIGDDLGGMKAFDRYVISLLKSNKSVLIFPEAALWPYYRKIRPFNKGAFNFSIKAQKPILPIIITFRTRKNGKQKMIVNILPAIYPKNKSIKDFQEETETLYKNFVEDFYSKYR